MTERSQRKVSGTFGVVSAVSPSVKLGGKFNLTLSGTFSATVVLKRSFDDGTSWFPVATDSIGTATAYTAPCSVVGEEPEEGVSYRLECTVYASGTVTYRLSQ